MRVFSACFNAVIKYFFLSSAVIMAVIWILVVLNVIMRRLLGAPVSWSVEAGEYGLVAITFLSAAWLLKGDKHPSIDLVVIRLNKWSRRLLNIFVNVLGMLVCLTIAWYGGRSAWEQFLEGTMLIGAVEIPAWPLHSIIPLGSFLLSVQFLMAVYGHINGSYNATADRTPI